MTNRHDKDKMREKVIREKTKQGKSFGDIAIILDCDKATVSRLADKYKIKPVNKFPRGFK
jgi:transposase